MFDPADARGRSSSGSTRPASSPPGRFARDFNDSLGNAAPFFTGGADLLRPLAEQEVALRRVFRDTGRVFHAVSREDGQLRGLITNGDATFGALASRDDALAETFQIFPTFLRETRATVRRLEAFAKNTDPLVRDLRAAGARPRADAARPRRPLARPREAVQPHPPAGAGLEDRRAGRRRAS